VVPENTRNRGRGNSTQGYYNARTDTLYGLTGYDLLLLLPVGKQLDNVGDIFATREEALMLYNGHDVKGKFETFKVSCGHCKKSEFELKHRLQRCGKYQDAFYCSSSCQKNDWDNHKVQCKIDCHRDHEK
jgi:hypothetical protein